MIDLLKKIVNYLGMILGYLIYFWGILLGGLILLTVVVLYKDIILVIIFVAAPILIYLFYKEFQLQRKKRQLAEEEERKYKQWIEQIEPTLRDVKGYPEDWSERRGEVYRRACGRCASCGITYIEEYHVHHKVPISAGGNHDFSNLELLCEDCHIEKHPDNEALRTTIHLRKLRELHVGADAKIKRARYGWTCALCQKQIRAREFYYGGRGEHKLCMGCYHPKM